MALLLGVNVPPVATPDADPVAQAKRAEDAGFDFVSTNDHPCGTYPTHEVWTMLTWILARTSRIKVAPRVLGVPYRPPPMVAKMAESLDRLSGGRLILGLGGGASDEEFKAFGLGVPSPRDKVDGLAEAIRIIRGLWSDPTFTFEGRLYQTKGAAVEPKPEHHIPIWLGTYGPRALAVTGRLADGWIPTLELAPPNEVTDMRDRVLAAAREAGRPPEAITCVYNLDFRLDESSEWGPSVVSGSTEAVTETLSSFTKLGFTALNVSPVGPAKEEQVERFGKEVLPALRDAA